MGKRRTKLSDSDVLLVFQLTLAGWSIRRLAVRFGVSKVHLGYILNGQRRASVGRDDPARAAIVRLEQAAAAVRVRRWKATFAMQHAVDDYMGGRSLAVASAKWGVAKTTLWRELNRRGLKRRSKAKGNRTHGGIG